jgi:hypothetical protein
LVLENPVDLEVLLVLLVPVLMDLTVLRVLVNLDHPVDLENLVLRLDLVNLEPLVNQSPLEIPDYLQILLVPDYL